MSHRNWGKPDYTKIIVRGVLLMGCSSHGGIRITRNAMQKNPLLQRLRDYPEIEKFWEGDAYYFEEDCAAAMVRASFPQEKLQAFYDCILNEDLTQEILDDTYSTLISYYPDFYTYITGKGLSIFDSHVLLRRYLQEHPHSQSFVFLGSSRSRTWDIPDDHVYINVKDAQGNYIPSEGYLITRAQYNEIWKGKNRELPLNTSEFQPFTPNTDLPLTKVKNPDPNTYYRCAERIQEGSNTIVRGYNYQRKAFKEFLMTEAHFKQFLNSDLSETFIFQDEEHQILRPEFLPFIQVLEHDHVA